MTPAEAENLVRMVRRFINVPFDANQRHREDGEVKVRFEFTVNSYAEAVKIFGRDCRGELLNEMPAGK